MNLVGLDVTHKVFGHGEVITIADNKIDILFTRGTKSFQYPNCFEEYVQTDNVEAQLFIDQKLQQIYELKKQEELLRKKKEEAYAYARKVKKSTNSHAAFDLHEDAIENTFTHWNIFVGNHIIGKLKGTPRIPKNMNLNSACIITAKGEHEEERNRSILGIFMVPEHFIGEQCSDGLISAHDRYRILWLDKDEKLLFWNYFPKETRLTKWGTSQLKYIPGIIVKKILEDMVYVTSEEDPDYENILSFYHYFCQINHL